MITKKEIEQRQDVELLVKEFYKKVRANETLGYIFDDIMKIDWDHHIPILTGFWETILLDTASYQRNAMGVHFTVNQKIKLESHHFTEWLRLFDETVDEFFLGERALLAKKRAHSVADLMLLKLSRLED